MTHKESDQPIGFADNNLNFEAFSKQPEYVEVNRGLIQKFVSRLRTDFCLVDVATGTGLAAQLIIDAARRGGKKGRIIGIDPNVTSLNIAKRRVQSSSGVVVEFIEGKGQNLIQLLSGIIPPGGVDGVSILDALHEIGLDEDKVKVIRAMADILKTGGLLIFNSAFTTDGISIDPISWGKLKLLAMGILGGKRDKQVQTMPIHPPDIYKEMIENAGLKVIHEAKQIVNLTKEALIAISKYPPFFRGALEDMRGQESVPDIKKSDAFIQAINELGASTLPRVWYELIAERTPCGLTPSVNPT